MFFFTVSLLFIHGCYCKDYDFVIVGGGTAGLTLAYKLSEVSRYKIIILEAGDVIKQRRSGLDALNGETDWCFTTEDKFSGLNNGSAIWHSGRGLAGSSHLSHGIYSKGRKEDYCEWGKNIPGWKYRNVKNYLFHVEREFYGSSNDSTRGFHTTVLGTAFDKGLKELERHPTWTGKLSQIKLHSENRRPVAIWKKLWAAIQRRCNVRVETGAYVTKIKLNPKTKRGTAAIVEINGKLYRVSAKRELILCAGVVKTSQILMLSGVGPSAHLRDMGIKTILNLPVGSDIRDHIAYPGLNYMVDPDVVNDFMKTRRTGGVESIGFLFGKSKNRPDVELVLVNKLINKKLKSWVGISDKVYEKNYKMAEHLFGMHIFPILLHPQSNGTVRLQSKNPKCEPEIRTSYLKHPLDVQRLADAIIFIDENLTRTTEFEKIRPVLYPAPICENLPYKSREYWEKALTKLVVSFGDYMGGNKMGARSDTSSVVDCGFRIRGLKNVRIVDASVIPVTMSGHVEATVVMLAEKAAKIIKRTYKRSSCYNDKSREGRN